MVTVEEMRDAPRHIVVQAKAMSPQEKKVIENLIDKRAESLSTYLDEMQSFANEANAEVTVTDAEEAAQIQKDLAQITLDKERITERRKEESRAVEHVLEEEKQGKLTRIQNLVQKITEKYNELLRASEETITKKYAKREDELVAREVELNAQIARMKRTESQHALIRKVAIGNSFRALKDQIGDARNRAVETLHTEVYENTGAKQCLSMLPDAGKFRAEVTPEKLFGVFNNNVKEKCLSFVGKTKCKNPKCGSEDIIENSRGKFYCRKCGQIDVLSREVCEIVALPTLAEIVKDSNITSETLLQKPVEVTIVEVSVKKETEKPQVMPEVITTEPAPVESSDELQAAACV
jgi:hypothetical protein